MATTLPDGIVYPLSSDPISPLATHFADLATSVQGAVTGVRDDMEAGDASLVGLIDTEVADREAADDLIYTEILDVRADYIAADTVVTNATDVKLNATSRTVADQAARDALYPTPVQGDRVYRADGGLEEAYFALYNASTNPGGATPAGWYPVTKHPRDDSGWLVFPLASGWTSEANNTVSYRKLNGVVYFRGRASGPSNTTIGTLPSGYRPFGANNVFISDSSGPVRINVTNTGTVALLGTSGTQTSLSNITFAI